MLSIFLLFLNIPVIFGCRYNYYDYGYNPPPPKPKKPPTTTPAPVDKNDRLGMNLPEAWGGFKPPHGLEKKWRDWLDDYNKKRELEENEGDDKYKHERGPGSGWPPSWMGLGGGFDGAEAPPWAYHPINTGLPEYCYFPLKVGSCKQKLKRWAFNPYTAQCTEFIYSGCDENQNNFKEKVKCEAACMKMPISGCDPETQMYIEDD